LGYEGFLKKIHKKNSVQLYQKIIPKKYTKITKLNPKLVAQI